MPEYINYTKLINLINTSQYSEAFQELSSLEKKHVNSFPLMLIKLFCQIEMGKMRSSKILVNNLLKIYPEYQLLKNVSIYLKSPSSGEEKNRNPLNDFIVSFIHYNESELSKMNEQQFNQLMEQILIKPYIK